MNVHSDSADRTSFLSRWQIFEAPGPAVRQQVDEVKADRINRRMAFRLAQSKVEDEKPAVTREQSQLPVHTFPATIRDLPPFASDMFEISPIDSTPVFVRWCVTS